MKTNRMRVAALVAVACIATIAFGQDGEGGRPAERGGARERPGHGRERSHGSDPSSVMRESLSLARLASSERVAKELGLTDEQVKTLKEKSYALKKEQINLRAKQELAAMEQVRLMSEDEIDEEALMKAVEKTAAISGELAKLAVRQILLVKQTLTKEQLTQMRAMMRQHMQERAKAMQRGRNGGGQGQRGRPDERSHRGRGEDRDRPDAREEDED